MKTIRLLVSFFLLFSAFQSYSQQSADKKIEKIIGKMSLKEKIDFIGGYEGYNIRPYPDLGIPLIRTADGPVGVRNYGPSTAYPAAINLAASWDTAMAERVGSAIGQEARAKNVQIMLGPGMNICRAPMCGRNFEYLGEDPFLAGKMAASYIIGIQNQGVMATAKHYDANFQEYDRYNVSSDMDARTLHEIYLLAFKAAVTKGKVAAVMTSYNLINGVHASENKNLISNIMKNDWGFDGFVMSDWGSTYNGVADANAGLDLEMPAGTHMSVDTLLPAIKKGLVSEKTIDDKVRRILREYQRFGLLNNHDSSQVMLDSVAVRKTAIDEARDGIVLLKNENQFLPLDTSKIKSIALIGPNAWPAVTGGGGSSYVQPLHPLSLLDATKRIAGNNIRVEYAPGVRGQEKIPVDFYDSTDFYTYEDGMQVPGMTVAVYNNRRPDGHPDYRTIFAKVNHVFQDSIPGIPKHNFAAVFNGCLKSDTSGVYRFIVSCSAGFMLSVNNKQVSASWQNDSEQVYSALVPLEEGKENKITLTYFQRDTSGIIRLAYETPAQNERKEAAALDKAAQLAGQCDLTVLSVGFNKDLEKEGSDRTFQLPEEQEKLIQKIVETGKDFIVVVNAGGNIDMNNWIDEAKGLVYAWYPGQEGSLAVTEILFGITNPSGKLPVSFPRHWKDYATYNSYYDTDNDKHVEFTEGIFLGYRHLDEDNINPLFPFGFGLSYTTFKYSDLTVSEEQLSNPDNVDVSLDVTNTGNRDGAEIVELYVSNSVSALKRPVKELKAFSKVWLKAGETKKVIMKLNKEAFQYYDPAKKQWVVEPGEFDILVGSSSRDLRLKHTITVID